MADLDNFDSAKAIAESIGTVEKSWGLGPYRYRDLRRSGSLISDPADLRLLNIRQKFLLWQRRNDVNPEITDRFEFFGGREIGNGFSELNDAEDQARASSDQVAAKDAGDDEAMFYDEDYVTALEHGLPPPAGLGNYRPYGNAVHQQPPPRRYSVPGDASGKITSYAQPRQPSGFYSLGKCR